MIANQHIQVLIPPDSGARKTPRPGRTGGRYTAMRNALAPPAGKELYRRRKQMIEPVLAHTKHNRQVTRFLRTGRIAVRTEQRSLMTTHNLTKLQPPPTRRHRGLKRPSGGENHRNRAR